MITVTSFDRLPPGRDHPERAEAMVMFGRPDGIGVAARLSLFMLEDGRIGIGVYPSPLIGKGVHPSPDRGTVLRWDDGPDAEPRVIAWEAPHCADDECGSPCGHQGGSR